MKRKKVFGLIVVLVLAILGYYFVSPIFITTEVNDPDPFASNMASGAENLSRQEAAEFNAAMEAAEQEPDLVVIENMPENMTAGMPTVSFPVLGTRGHPASGQVKILDVNDTSIIRFENFETINGPELHLYLAKDLEANDYIDLGPIRGTKGNINYTIPAGVDISEYRYVLHWCVPFGVLFNYAEIEA